MDTTQGSPIPCPYELGSTFRLQVTPPIGDPFEANVTVVSVYTPFTISPVMKVSVDSTTCAQGSAFKLPPELVLKVYDRRFALSLRKRYYLQPPTYESEERYREYVNSGRAPEGAEAISDEIDTVCTGGIETCPPALLEHLIATRIGPYSGSECAVYERLEGLQGRDVPIFYGSTRFLDGSSAPGLSLSIPGVLLEVIPGSSLEDIDVSAIDLNAVINNALRIVDICGDLDVLNKDVRLGNFIVKPDDSVVMIDFAQTRFRRADEDDLAWKRAKWSEDEEGCIGTAAMRKFGWDYARSFKYLPPPEEGY
ncbi:hypothetical protein FRC12_008367 [Ceratobasidium sp. 428]|nr:hypothetical protein FRC12_008367 [Ceratobasidium sp. 428]